MRKLSAIAIAGLFVATMATPAHAETNTNKHVIEYGDTFWDLAQEKDIAVQDIIELNPNAEVTNLQIGQAVLLPGEGRDVAVERQVAPAPQKAPQKPVQAKKADTVWDRLAQCESGGDWSINTGNGFYGGLQFTQQSWNAMGGTGSPANATRAEQIAVAERLQDVQGWGAWPACSAKLGLR